MNICCTKIKEINGKENYGNLLFFEANRDLGFEIKRVYYICKAKKGTIRGGHAHKKLKQFFFCPYGKIQILFDDGNEKREVILEDPVDGIFVSPCVWREMIWLKDDSVLCVAASEYYTEDDYIRDYDAFLRYINDLKEKDV